MLWMPPTGFAAIQTNLAATPTTLNPGTSCTGGAANTKGSWTQVFASTDFDVQYIRLLIGQTFTVATNTSALLDVGLGANPNEVVVIENLLVGFAGGFSSGELGGARSLSLPFFIPRGTPVSIRCQGVQASKVVNATMWLYGGSKVPLPTFSRMDAYGVTSSGNSIGTLHTPGASGAESAWASVGSTTSRDYDAIIPIIQGSSTDTAITARAYHWEIGYSSTTLGEYYVMASSNESIWQFPDSPVFQTIPSGTQLQVRAESSGTAPDAIDVAIYGLA